jgi:hypothetical protein
VPFGATDEGEAPARVLDDQMFGQGEPAASIVHPEAVRAFDGLADGAERHGANPAQSADEGVYRVGGSDAAHRHDHAIDSLRLHEVEDPELGPLRGLEVRANRVHPEIEVPLDARALDATPECALIVVAQPRIIQEQCDDRTARHGGTLQRTARTR